MTLPADGDARLKELIAGLREPVQMRDRANIDFERAEAAYWLEKLSVAPSETKAIMSNDAPSRSASERRSGNGLNAGEGHSQVGEAHPPASPHTDKVGEARWQDVVRAIVKLRDEWGAEWPERGKQLAREVYDIADLAMRVGESAPRSAGERRIDPAYAGADPAAEYERRNPLGGPAKVFEAMAARIRAGEDYYSVLDDYNMQVKQATHSAIKGCQHEWPGPGPQPASFMCKCGTKVYRSYEDYVDD